MLRENEQPPRLVVDGEIDHDTERDFRRALRNAVSRHDRLVVDLTPVRRVNGAGIATLDAYSSHYSAVLVAMHSPVSAAVADTEVGALVAQQPHGSDPESG